MKKFLIAIIVLSAFILFSYRYLRNSIDQKKTFIFTITSKPLIYCKRKLEIEDKDIFEFNDFFTILSNSDYQFKYSFVEESILVSLNNEKFSYPYKIKEKEKEIVTEYVIKEVYINNSNVINSEHDQGSSYHSTEWINNSNEYETGYLNLLNSTLSFETGTDLSTIINAIQNSIETNLRISVDYSLLNPNDPGDYPVNIYSESENHQIIIKII